jgi:hypothetical protein
MKDDAYICFFCFFISSLFLAAAVFHLVLPQGAAGSVDAPRTAVCFGEFWLFFGFGLVELATYLKEGK